MKTFAWPQGVRCAVFLSVHFDAESYDLKSTTEDRLFGRFSYGRYGVRAGLPRLLAMLQRRTLAATVFVTADDARRHEAEVRALAEAGHEIASRGADLRPLPELREGERASLAAAHETLATIAGRPPVGFRAAGGELSSGTLATLAGLGYRYDSSFQDADHPYVFAPTPGARIAELPTVQALDDAPLYSARHTMARLDKVWREEFDALHAEGCLVPMTVHLRGDMGSTRAARIAVLDDLLAYMASKPGVRFVTCAQLAEMTLAQDLPGEPDPCAAHQATLAVTPYRGDLSIKPI